MPHTTERSFFERSKGLAAALVLRLAGRIPIVGAQSLGVVLGWCAYYANIREVRIARRNIDLCLKELSQADKTKVLKQSMLSFGMQLFEVAYLWRNSPTKALQLINNVHGEEVFERAMQNKQGILLILPHLGNWELLNAFILERIPGVAMFSPAKLPEINALMCQGRTQTGLELAEANKKGVLYLLKQLKQGGNLFILPDQEPDRSGGAFAPFFGHEALTMTLISKFLAKSEAVPLLAYVQRRGVGKGFDVVFKEVEGELRSQDTRESLTCLNAAIESSIREIPEQYMWGYKRFRGRPDGEEKLYRNLK